MMKKIIFGTFVIMMASCCKGPSQTDKFHSINPERISLNGIAFATASKMVQNFQDAPGSYSTKTTFHFSNQYIENLDALLNTEGADGIRIYLARTDNALSNTIIIVSTKDDGPDAKGLPIHLDYFKHSAQFLHTLTANFEENGNDGGDATLFTNPNCPPESCNVQALNYISCDDASKWVRHTSEDDINTNAEWFSRDVIDYLNLEVHAAIKAGVLADGIRIYLAENSDDDTHKFIITTTKTDGKYHKDYYECHTPPPSHLTDNGELCPDHCDGVTLPQQ
jgi:hypothetical protein